MDFDKLQELVRSNSKPMNAFFKSGGKEVPNGNILESYRELIKRILDGVGGASPSQATPKAIEVQTERLKMVEEALKNIK